MRLLVILLIILISSTMAFGQHYLFYLHGKIIEDQGIPAIDTVNGFGAYRYEEILTSFKEAGFAVMSEVRQKNTDVTAYAHKTVDEINSLIKQGTDAAGITVVGASKGAIIAMLISAYLKNKDVNFVLMAGCNKSILQAFPDIQFCGNILSIYEQSDNIGQSCASFKSNSTLAIPHYKEIALNTGLKHGFLYKPLPAWMEPAIAWANKNYQ